MLIVSQLEIVVGLWLKLHKIGVHNMTKSPTKSSNYGVKRGKLGHTRVFVSQNILLGLYIWLLVRIAYQQILTSRGRSKTGANVSQLETIAGLWFKLCRGDVHSAT